MPPKKTKRVRTNVDILAFTGIISDLDWMRCQVCEGSFSLLQPDQLSSQQLLGVCDDCRALYLIFIESNHKEAIMVLLQTSEWYKSIVEAGKTDDDQDLQ